MDAMASDNEDFVLSPKQQTIKVPKKVGKPKIPQLLDPDSTTQQN